jgi:hypothetical protein
MDFRRFISKIYVHICFYSKYWNIIENNVIYKEIPVTYAIGLKKVSPLSSLSVTHPLLFSTK